MAVRVHIAGLTRPEDAAAAAAAGADAFGISFWPQATSSVDVERAQEIVAALPRDAFVYGMFVDAVASVVERTLERTGVALALFAGTETPEYCRPFVGKYARVVRVKDLASLEVMSRYECPFYVLDGDPAVQGGGREVAFDLNLARRAKRQGKVVLSGGLTVDSVAAAVRVARPYGVEVSAGVESTLGVKDPRRLRRFIEAAKGA